MVRNLILGVLVAAATFGLRHPLRRNRLRIRARQTSKRSLRPRIRIAWSDTASRIKRPPDKTVQRYAGHARIRRQELENTGRLDTAEALKQLDPRIQ